jgi:hypothetical protein
MFRSRSRGRGRKKGRDENFRPRGPTNGEEFEVEVDLGRNRVFATGEYRGYLHWSDKKCCGSYKVKKVGPDPHDPSQYLCGYCDTNYSDVGEFVQHINNKKHKNAVLNEVAAYELEWESRDLIRRNPCLSYRSSAVHCSYCTKTFYTMDEVVEHLKREFSV